MFKWIRKSNGKWYWKDCDWWEHWEEDPNPRPIPERGTSGLYLVWRWASPNWPNRWQAQRRFWRKRMGKHSQLITDWMKMEDDQ